MTPRIPDEILSKMTPELGGDDGVDPREFFRAPRNDRGDRKARQLCRQAERALSYSLAAASDEVLRDLVVEGVQPAPNASHLLVLVSCANAQLSQFEVLDHLHRASGFLRTEVAAAIHRRKTPLLSFQYVAAGDRG